MNLETLFRFSAYILIGSGPLALALTGGMDWISMIFYTAAYAGSGFVKPSRVNARIPRLWSWGFLTGLLLYGLDLFFISGDFLGATVRLVLFTSALKLFTLRSDRDYVFLFLISFTQLVVASTLTTSLSFLFSLALFLVAAIATLILLEIQRSLSESRRPDAGAAVSRTGYIQDLTRRFQPAAFWGTVVSLTLLILGLALPIFFLIPRLQSSFVSRRPPELEYLSGFSDRVVLGELGQIKKNNGIVMRVKVDTPLGELPPDMKWRGIALDKYDGKTWSRSLLQRSRIQRSPGRSYFELSNEPNRGRLVSQTIYLQPVNTDMLFVLNQPKALALDLPEPQQSLFRDRMGSLSRLRFQPGKLRYTVWSDLYTPSPQRLSSAPIPLPTEAPAVRAYFDLPPLDPRIAQLAQTLTGGLSHPYEKARKIESHLRGNYGYSLDMAPNAAGADPLAVFLFESRRGHCEYFASAMAVMLRTQGIPSRIVNGFQSGEYNELGQDFIVRQSHAHTWVEVFFPGENWVAFDPTPPDPQAEAGRDWFAWILKAYDAAELYWDEHFIRYNLWRQVQLFAGMRASLVSVVSRINDWIHQGRLRIENRMMIWEASWAGGSRIRFFLPPVALAVLAFLAFRFRHRLRWWYWRARGRRVELQKAVVIEFYGTMLDLLKRRGHAKPAASTAREFVASLREQPYHANVSALTELYYRLRFRGDPATPENLAEARRLLRQIRSEELFRP